MEILKTEFGPKLNIFEAVRKTSILQALKSLKFVIILTEKLPRLYVELKKFSLNFAQNFLT